MLRRFCCVVAVLAGLALVFSGSTIGIDRTLSVPSSSRAILGTAIQPCTSISKEDYDHAVRKWQELGILEYEITVSDLSSMAVGGTMKLHFKVENGESALVSYTDLNGEQPLVIPVETLSEPDLKFLRGRSVEEMFRRLGRLFAGELPDPVTGEPASPDNSYVECYRAEFEQSLGYPSLIVSAAFPQDGGAQVTDCCVYYEVLDMQILRSGIPGMPKAGNPGY